MNESLRCVVSVSGFRGILGDTLNPADLLGLGAAIGTAIAKGGPVVVGRDSRPTGELCYQALAAGLRGVGCTVIDLGIVPTPTVPLQVKALKAAAGVQISASHNPVEWNALKVYTRKGRNIDKVELERLLQVHDEGAAPWKAWDGIGGERRIEDPVEAHLAAVLKAVDVDRIRAAALTVVIDSVNGAGAVLAPRLLDALGCRVIPLYSRTDRLFPRDPEPTADNVRETGRVVKAVGAAIGFVQDPDADRLACIDEYGHYIGEEYTLVLCAAARLAAAKEAGVAEPVAVTNLSTSRMLEDVAAGLGGRVLRTPVGEANVLDAMAKEKAVVGGEGNGGVVDPRVVSCRDSHIAMALILEQLARSGGALSTSVAAIPRYSMHKEKIDLDRAAVEAAIPGIKASRMVEDAIFDEQDGLKIIWPDRWLHVRASGTEPVSRIISEAPDQRSAKSLASRLRKDLGARIVSGH